MRVTLGKQVRPAPRMGGWGMAAACIVVAAPGLMAQSDATVPNPEDWYVGLDVGAAFVTDFTVRTESSLHLPFLPGLGPVIVPADFPQRLSLDPGIRVNGSVAFRFWRQLHLEFQPGWIRNSGSASSTFETLGPDPDNPFYSIGITRSDVDLTQIPLLAHLVGIAPLSERWKVCVGLGIGAVLSSLCVNYSIDYFNDSDYGRLSAKSESDFDVSFAYQFKASLEYSLSEDLAVGIGYQFLGVGETQWDLLGGKVSTPDLYTHSVLATVNYKF
ncbi:MAG: outer membrane beta-barrel protein [Verrucomicrobia bacterium]|nr:outer membrane beta-barrel protein [Verrucomicrobiota bacterium]